MSNGELPTRERDEIAQIGTVANIGQERAVFIVHGLPVRAVHLRVVEVVALVAPGLLEDLRPLGAWIDEHLELPDVDRAVTDFRGLVGGDDSPAAFRRAARGLIEELFPVGRERVRANALEERSRRALLDREALEAQAGRRVRH